jgi:hypothetical protein
MTIFQLTQDRAIKKDLIANIIDNLFKQQKLMGVQS